MTKEEQLIQFGMEVPQEYRGFVFNRDPMWSAEHFQAALHYARKYSNPEENEQSIKVEIVN